MVGRVESPAPGTTHPEGTGPGPKVAESMSRHTCGWGVIVRSTSSSRLRQCSGNRKRVQHESMVAMRRRPYSGGGGASGSAGAAETQAALGRIATSMTALALRPAAGGLEPPRGRDKGKAVREHDIAQHRAQWLAHGRPRQRAGPQTVGCGADPGTVGLGRGDPSSPCNDKVVLVVRRHLHPLKHQLHTALRVLAQVH